MWEFRHRDACRGPATEGAGETRVEVKINGILFCSFLCLFECLSEWLTVCLFVCLFVCFLWLLRRPLPPCWGCGRWRCGRAAGSRRSGRPCASARWAARPVSPAQSEPAAEAAGPDGPPECSSACPIPGERERERERERGRKIDRQGGGDVNMTLSLVASSCIRREFIKKKSDENQSMSSNRVSLISFHFCLSAWQFISFNQLIIFFTAYFPFPNVSSCLYLTWFLSLLTLLKCPCWLSHVDDCHGSHHCMVISTQFHFPS